MSARNRLNEVYNIIESSTLGIAESYSESISKYTQAKKIATELLDEKILVASEAVLLIETQTTGTDLTKLAEQLRVDQLNIYNDQAVIIASNVKEYIGWKASKGHPVHNFFINDQRVLVEEIRTDTVNGLNYKYGYIRRYDNTFVQIGVLAENVFKFTNQFEIQHLINDIVQRDEILHAYYIDENLKVVARSAGVEVETIEQNYGGTKDLLKREAETERCTWGDEEVIQVRAPIFSNDKYLGTLVIHWPTSAVDRELKSIILNDLFEFFITILVLALVLVYAYRKSISNVKLAYYDNLTELPNNVYLNEYLAEEIASRGNKNLSVLMLNCTNFKTLNMTYGYKYGDQILNNIAQNLTETLIENEKAFRFNADRFVVILKGYESRAVLQSRAISLIEAFKKTLAGNAKYEYISAQASIYEIRGDVTADKIFQDLDLAMLSIKEDAKEQVAFFDITMENDILRSEQIERTLKDVIEGKDNESFFLHYQPKVDLKTNQVMGFEALARLNSKEIGNVSPIEFIDLAEKKLLIYDLGKQIISRSCAFANQLKFEGFENVTVALNISVLQILREEFLNDVKKIIASHKTEFSALEFELTESAIVENFELINHKLMEIKKLGIAVALDDFGTGYSSFARLHEAQIDTVKIDRYFIGRLDKLPSGQFLTEDIISMSHKLGYTVVAEGVETKTQLEYLKEHNCDFAQGFLFSKPVSEKEAILFLRNKSIG